MLTPIELKKLVDASFTAEGICARKLGTTIWQPFNPSTAVIQIGDSRYEWIETQYLPNPQDKGRVIGNICNYEGNLCLRQLADGGWQWGINDYNEQIDFKTIPNYLAEALLRYERERDK